MKEYYVIGDMTLYKEFPCEDSYLGFFLKLTYSLKEAIEYSDIIMDSSGMFLCVEQENPTNESIHKSALEIKKLLMDIGIKEDDTRVIFYSSLESNEISYAILEHRDKVIFLDMIPKES